jgi:dienelactone hydrolase
MTALPHRSFRSGHVAARLWRISHVTKDEAPLRRISMQIADVPYEADGRIMIGHLAFDDTQAGPRPAVLVSHEGPGLDRHAKGIAEKLAALGYAAFALDYNGDGRPLPADLVMERIVALSADPQRAGRLARAGLDVLLARAPADPGRVAAIGYCFGGVLSLELARTGADLRAVVGFHPGYLPPRTADPERNIRASILMCSGTEDPFATPELRMGFEAEMREAGVADWRMELYGGVGHSFTNPEAGQFGMPGVAYNDLADRRSWQSMLRLFDEVLN